MCINPRLLRNKKYMPNQKNGGSPPPLTDLRKQFVPIGCGNCWECRKRKRNDWTIRLTEEIKNDSNNWTFVTLTFNEQKLQYHRDKVEESLIDKDTGELKCDIEDFERLTDDNRIATLAVRMFLERWRKKTGKSVRHFFITEKGHKNTKRIHLHGLIRSRDLEMIRNTWLNGYIWPRRKADMKANVVNEKTINYIVKYITKVDKVNIGFYSKILCSPGIGRNYINSTRFELHRFNGENTLDYYLTNTNHKLGNPIYYRNYLYTENERDILWSMMLDKGKRYVFGIEIDINSIGGWDQYFKSLIYYREKNKELGYFTDPNWTIDKYSKSLQSLGSLKVNEKSILSEIA